jgi:hypothetical protein
MIFNSENSLILRILIQTKCHKIPGSVLNNLFLLAKILFTDKSITKLKFGLVDNGINKNGPS